MDLVRDLIKDLVRDLFMNLFQVAASTGWIDKIINVLHHKFCAQFS